MSQEASHSDLPWIVEETNGKIYIINGYGTLAWIGPCGRPDEEDKKNAKFIVKAVNNHEALVDVIGRLIQAGTSLHAPSIMGATNEACALLAEIKGAHAT